MNAVLFSDQEELKKYFTAQFLFLGINIFTINNEEKLFELCSRKNIDCFMLDLKEKKIDWVYIVRKLRERTKGHGATFTVINDGHNHLYINKLIMEGVSAFLNRGELYEDTIRKLGENLLSRFKENEKREFIRIVPDKSEKIDVNIEIKGKSNYGYFRGELLDLSAIGAAVGFDAGEPLELMNEKRTYINTVQIIIKNRIYSCTGMVLRKAGNIAVIKFNEPNDFFKIGIASYIAQKVCC